LQVAIIVTQKLTRGDAVSTPDFIVGEEGEKRTWGLVLVLKSLFPLMATLLLSKQRIPKFYPIPRRRDPEFVNRLNKQSQRPLTERCTTNLMVCLERWRKKTLYNVPVRLIKYALGLHIKNKHC